MVREQLHARASDPFAAAVLPVIIHRMNNTTQLLSNLQAILQVDGDTDWLARRADDLSASAADMHRLGYLLAVLSSAAGADLLMTRRVPEGLDIVLRGVADLARRAGRDLPLPPEGLPLQTAEVHGGWELPWGFGALLHQAVMELPEGCGLDWQLLREEQAWVLICSENPPREFETLHLLIAERLPETVLEARDGGWSWRLPTDWLRVTTPDDRP